MKSTQDSGVKLYKIEYKPMAEKDKRGWRAGHVVAFDRATASGKEISDMIDEALESNDYFYLHETLSKMLAVQGMEVVLYVGVTEVTMARALSAIQREGWMVLSISEV